MKKSLLLTCALAACSTMAYAEVINIEFTQEGFHQKYYASDGDWYTVIKAEPDEFMFDILGPADGLVSGQAYTFDDMMQNYSFGIDYTDNTQIKYNSASYTETSNEDGSKTIYAEVDAENGNTYIFTGTYSPSEEPEMIQMPEGLETIDCVLSCYDIDYGDETFDARLAFDGSDVYLEGCGYVSYFFQSVIKGTRQGNILTFPNGQCVGFGSTANYFLFGLDFNFNLKDVVFTYDADQEAYLAGPEDAIAVCQDAQGDLSTFYELIYNIALTPSEPVAIESVAAEQQLPTKRFHDGKFIINAKGMDFNALGQRVK